MTFPRTLPAGAQTTVTRKCATSSALDLFIKRSSSSRYSNNFDTPRVLHTHALQHHFCFRTLTAVHVRCLTTVNTFLSTFAFGSVLLGLSSSLVVGNIDTATRRQCQLHDWHAHQATAHIKFCRTYGYFQ